MARPSTTPRAPATDEVRFEPCAPTEVYAQQENWPADTRDARVHARRQRRRTRARGVVSLMWAGVVAIAAVQHAGEVERRIGAREPSVAELAMQARPARQITAAWHDIANRETIEAPIAQAAERQAAAPAGASGGPSHQQAVVPDLQVDTDARPIAGAIEDAQQPVAASLALASGSTNQLDGGQPSANAAEAEKLAPQAGKARLSPTASPAQDPVDGPTRSRSRARQPRALSSSKVVTTLYLEPGDFVPALYFTVKGMNRHSP